MQPDDDFGDDGDDPLPSVIHIWPENQAAWLAWCGVSTQWRVGFAGLIGLDYAGVRAWLLDFEPERGQRRDIWSCLQVCEAELLRLLAVDRMAEQEADQGDAE